jgi:ATP/maltotriose-dependent transcriptional regulator MalT
MVTTRPTAASYIIKRPRLTKLLDESEARIILLCAPAGYGKTTLAREWAGTSREPVAWYRGGSEMVDPSALATGLCECLRQAGLFAKDTSRIATLAANNAPANALGRAVASGVPGRLGGLVVIDDYHNASESEDAEALLAAFVSDCSLRVLVTSRERPSWLTPRMEVYGEALHIGAVELVFTNDEADVVLQESSPEERAAVFAQAQGWPAVIGLAALRGNPPTREHRLPSELFNFLADDLFEVAPEPLKQTLILLALGGAQNLDVLRGIVGVDLQWHLATAYERGFITREPEEQWDIHPLIRSFLVEKLREYTPTEIESLVETMVTALIAARRWDDCLRTLSDFPDRALVEQSFAAAFLELIDLGRTATVRRWLELANSCGSQAPLLIVAEADLALREQDEMNALALAEHAVELLDQGEMLAYTHLVAARAAHLQSNRAAFERNATAARTLTNETTTLVATMWLEFLQAIESNDRPGARQVLGELAKVDDKSATHTLRLRNARAYLAFELEGRVHAAALELSKAEGLFSHVTDPMVRTNFRNVSAIVALYSAEYESALRIAEELHEDAIEVGLEFPVDHALVTRAGAFIGLRRLSEARRVVHELEKRASASDFIRNQIALKKVQIRVAAGDLTRAEVELRETPPSTVPLGMSAEWNGTKAIVLAAAGLTDPALRILDGGWTNATHIDGRNLARLSRAILEVRAGTLRNSLPGVIEILDDGNRDPVVFACRAFPPLATELAAIPALAQPLTSLLTVSHDADIGRAAGLDMPRGLRRAEKLSARESEVYELLICGRSNRQIARTLFISESTTKVHVRHIFEKLGVHTRAEAVAVGADRDC